MITRNAGKMGVPAASAPKLRRNEREFWRVRAKIRAASFCAGAEDVFKHLGSLKQRLRQVTHGLHVVFHFAELLTDALEPAHLTASHIATPRFY